MADGEPPIRKNKRLVLKGRLEAFLELKEFSGWKGGQRGVDRRMT